jgi:hypothetical protein
MPISDYCKRRIEEVGASSTFKHLKSTSMAILSIISTLFSRLQFRMAY